MINPISILSFHASTSLSLFYCSLIRPLPTSTLFPYTTLFRSRSSPKREKSDDPTQDLPSSRYHSLSRSEVHTSELQSRRDIVCRLLLEKINCFLLTLICV